MSTYTGETPSNGGSNDNTNTPVPASIVQFYEKFYATSDSPSEASHQAYIDSFTSDATLIMGSKKASGQSELLDLRRGLWSGPVQTRRHTLKKIFPWDRRGDEFMLYGDVLYGLKNGKELTVDWAARAVLVTESGSGSEVKKMSFYQVYLDSAPVANALKD